ncbi:DUF4145 domain-containing protein [Candidatus Parcubacteria bacterium]|nr:MAG: DUF4145 domain-containing protein [Candidatus Parcubacteria bacterium]
MILGYYDGLHYLDLLSSFQNTAWSCLHGSYPQDDPLVSCISNFKAQCYTKGVQLDYSGTWIKETGKWRDEWLVNEEKQIPCLFVISGYSKNLVFNNIFTRVAAGSNLVILYSEFLYSMYKEECKSLYDALNITEEKLKDCSKLKKIDNYGKGKIFYIDSDNEISDIKIERGPFGGRSDLEITQTQEELIEIINKISVFSVPYIDCYIRSIPATWPRDESLIIEIEVENKSCEDISSALIEISFLPEFEPISNTVIQLDNIKAMTKRSITTVVIPRVKGQFDNSMQIFITHNNISYPVLLLNSQIQILDNLQNLLRASKPLQIDIAHNLPKYEQYLKPVVTPDVILRLLEIDPDSVVAKVRRIGENISKIIARKKIRGFDSSWRFALITKELHDKSIISSKAKGYIDTIRIFGNMASHTDEIKTVSFSHEDALVVLHALLLFLKEATEVNLL